MAADMLDHSYCFVLMFYGFDPTAAESMHISEPFKSSDHVSPEP